MNTTEENIIKTRELIKSLIQKARDTNLLEWNDGLNFSDFIHALWRLFITHENFKENSSKILNIVSENTAINILAQEVKGVRS